MAATDVSFGLGGRVAIITGGAQSVGEGIARRFASAGAKVCIFDRNRDGAQAVATEIGGIAVEGDVTSADDIERCVRTAQEVLGPPAILVNNAAITGRVGCIWDLTKQDMTDALHVNLVGPFLCCKAVIGGMIERRYGRIVNIASIAGKEGNPTLIPYSASKAGLINMTKALAKEVVGKGDITVNAISPAVIRTKMLETVPQSTIDYMVSKIPMGRTCQVDEVAALVHYLASSDASFCTGQCYDISGGRATY